MSTHFELDNAPSSEASPFGLMISPEAVLQRMERSEQLAGLRKRVLRPLDAPWILRTAGKANVSAAMAAADAEIDGADEDECRTVN